jgi:nicotinamidase-related amidase
MLDRFLDDLEGVQGNAGVKAFEASIVLTTVAAVTNIAVSILKVLGSVIQLAQGKRDRTHFQSALKQFCWGVATAVPVIGGAVALGYIGYKTAVTSKGLEQSNQALTEQVVTLKKAVKDLELKNCGFKSEVNENRFPELAGQGLPIVSVQIDPRKVNQEFKAEAGIEEVLDADSLAEVKKLQALFKGQKINVLSMIDIQKGFLNGGSLMVPGAEEKILGNIERLLKENEFDLIVMTKDFHPKGHKSFTSSYYNTERTEDQVTFSLNEQGKALGVKTKELWEKYLLMGQFFNITHQDNGDIIFTAKEGDQDKLDGLMNGSLMPFAKALHPVAVTPHMFRNVALKVNEGSDPKEVIFKALKGMGLLNKEGQIQSNSKFFENSPSLKEAFKGTLQNVWDETFVEQVKQKLVEENVLSKESDNQVTTQILDALLEDLWPDHCTQGTDSHKFHEELVKILERQAKHIPIVPLVKGDSQDSGESYSGALNTKGFLASPYLPLLKAFNVEKNVIVGVAENYCPTNTAVDAQKNGVKTFNFGPGTHWITEDQHKAAEKLLSDNGVTCISHKAKNFKVV